MIPILIATVGRPRLTTMEFLTPEMQRHVTLITNTAERKSLAATYPLATVRTCPYQPEPGEVIDLSKKGLSRVRQWILEQWPDQKVLISDDDLPFYTRINPKKWSDWHARRASPEETCEGLRHMAELTEEYPMVGMSSKAGNNRQEAPIMFAVRMHNIWTIDCKVANRERFRFDAVPTMQDFWMHLCFLTAGYKTAMIADLMHCQNGSNTAFKTKSGGGCSLYRTNATQLISSRTLATEWPDFVKMVQKETKLKNTWFKGEARYDVHIQWKKALAYGQAKRNPLL